MQDAALWKSWSITFWSGWTPDRMRYLVISDIHANLDAFETVMAAAKPLNYDKVLLLGDLVGYGADPNAVCERIRDLKPDALIRGNHDKVCCGLESPDGFNAVARAAALSEHCRGVAYINTLTSLRIPPAFRAAGGRGQVGVGRRRHQGWLWRPCRGG